MFWVAFACAAAIHVGAVVLAKNQSEKTTIQDFTPPGADIEFLDTEPDPAPPDETVTPPPAELSLDEQTFVEENRAPQPVPPRKKTRIAFFTRGAATSLRSVKAMVAYAPRPVYPYEARRQRVTGSGVALLTIDQTSGTVTRVVMTQSCGNAILDNSTLDALRRWRFKPGSATKVQVPITYTLMGISY
jgi:periplasmic protein TonB